MLSEDIVREVVLSVLGRTQQYFQDEIGVALTEVGQESGTVDLLELRCLTAIVALGGEINLLIAFSFDSCLTDPVYTSLTADIDVPDDEQDLYRCEAVAELVNTIIGNCTADFQRPDQRISLSPPVVIQDAKRIQRSRNSVFNRLRLQSRLGNLDINFVGPVELFDKRLNYVK